MDHQLNKHHKNNPIPSPFTQFYSSKKAIQILLSLSFFSFLFSQFSLPLFCQTFSVNYSTDRNYIFLLCNGILFVIIKNSGLFANAPIDNEFRDDHVENIVHSDESKDLRNYNVRKTDQSHQSSVPDVLSGTQTEIIEEVEAKSNISSKEESDENVITFTTSSEVEDEDEDEDEEDELLKIVEDEEEDQLLNFVEEKEGDEFLDIKEKEEENEGLLSAEELNKKCDDFIRKMKDGIKIEAQYLIMVHRQS